MDFDKEPQLTKKYFPGGIQVIECSGYGSPDWARNLLKSHDPIDLKTSIIAYQVLAGDVSDDLSQLLHASSMPESAKKELFNLLSGFFNIYFSTPYAFENNLERLHGYLQGYWPEQQELVGELKQWIDRFLRPHFSSPKFIRFAEGGFLGDLD